MKELLAKIADYYEQTGNWYMECMFRDALDDCANDAENASLILDSLEEILDAGIDLVEILDIMPEDVLASSIELFLKIGQLEAVSKKIDSSTFKTELYKVLKSEDYLDAIIKNFSEIEKLYSGKELADIIFDLRKFGYDNEGTSELIESNNVKEKLFRIALEEGKVEEYLAIAINELSVCCKNKNAFAFLASMKKQGANEELLLKYIAKANPDFFIDKGDILQEFGFNAKNLEPQYVWDIMIKTDRFDDLIYNDDRLSKYIATLSDSELTDFMARFEEDDRDYIIDCLDKTTRKRIMKLCK